MYDMIDNTGPTIYKFSNNLLTKNAIKNPNSNPTDPRIISTCEYTDNSLSNFLRSEEHTSELQSRQYLVCRLLLEKKNSTGSAEYSLLDKRTEMCKTKYTH